MNRRSFISKIGAAICCLPLVGRSANDNKPTPSGTEEAKFTILSGMTGIPGMDASPLIGQQVMNHFSKGTVNEIMSTQMMNTAYLLATIQCGENAKTEDIINGVRKILAPYNVIV